MRPQERPEEPTKSRTSQREANWRKHAIVASPMILVNVWPQGQRSWGRGVRGGGVPAVTRRREGVVCTEGRVM